MRGRGRPDFRGGYHAQIRGRGIYQPRRNLLRGARRFSVPGPRNFRPDYPNGPEVQVPSFENVPIEVVDYMVPERRFDEEPEPAYHMEEGAMTEEDGEILDDPPIDALLPTPPPPGGRNMPALLPVPAHVPPRPPGPPPGPPPEGAQPFVPLGLTHHGQRMLQRSVRPRDDHLFHGPEEEDHIVSNRNMVLQNEFNETVREEASQEPEFLPPRPVEMVRERERLVRKPEPEPRIKAKDENGVPVFLLCPLCKDLLLKPLVLPCFHAICGERCIPKLVDDGFNIWCPTCQQLKATKFGIPSLKPAETFGKMSTKLRDEKRIEAIKKGEVPEHCTIEEFEDREFHKESKVDGLTCPECTKIFTVPLKLPCSHSICKFPCAYKILKHNVKIVCSICENANYCNEGVKGLPVDEHLIESIKTIKGDYFVEQFEQKLRDIAEGKDLKHRNPDGEPIGEEELNKYRFQKLNSAEQLSKSIPSLLNLDMQVSPPVKPPLLSQPPAQGLPPPSIPPEKQGAPLQGEGQPADHRLGEYSEDQVSQELRRIRNEDHEPNFRDARVPPHSDPNMLERPTAVIRPRGHFDQNHPPGPFPEQLEETQPEQAEDDYVAEDLPPELAAMANAWAGPKRCRPPKKNENQKKPAKYGKQFAPDRGNRADKFQKYEKSRERNKFIDDSVPPGVEVFEYENRSRPLPPKAPSLLDLNLNPPKLPLRGGRHGIKDGRPPIELLYPELADDLLLRRPFPRGRPPYPDIFDDLEQDPYFDPHLGLLPPRRLPPPPPMDFPPLGPHGIPPEGFPGMDLERLMAPPHPNEGMMPPRSSEGVMPPRSSEGMMPPRSNEGMMPPCSNEDMMPPCSSEGMMPPRSNVGMMPPPPPGAVTMGAPGIQPSVPGLNVMLNPVSSSIPSMIYGSGSGPPPIVNYGAPSTNPEPVPAPAAALQPGPSLPEPGQLQPAPASLPVMDPSTIPTMSSAFEYQAHWTKFVQQTQAYYNNLYAAQGGTPAEAQDTINDYLAKCWAWYSAYTSLCLVNPEYKDMGKEPKKEKKKEKQDQPPPAKTDNSGVETEEQASAKKEAKNKKKKNKNKPKVKPSEPPSKMEGIEDKDLEELKIMLIKKQLEMKVKHARNKSELRGLMNMKKLILEEEGDEKVEEIDEEEREKVKEAAKQKQLERAQEIERQEKERAKDREKEIQRLEQDRIREREKERQREREMKKKEIEERARKEKQRERDYHDREYDKYRGWKGDDGFRRKKRKRHSRSGSRSYSRSRSRSRSKSNSRSRSRSPVNDYRKKPGKEVYKEDTKDEEPKYIKIANLPDELKAVELKSFVEAFGRVLNCKIGKMQGEMMAVVQMASLADAMSCVRDMHGSQFKSKILEVKYMGNKPNLKSVEVSIPDVYAGPSSSGDKPKQQFKSMAGPNYGYGPDYYGKPPEIRHIWIGNLPWGTTEDEIMRFVYHHGTPLDCRIATSNDPSQRGLYAIVTMESYIDVLKCINSLHGIRYEGRTLDVKKMKY